MVNTHDDEACGLSTRDEVLQELHHDIHKREPGKLKADEDIEVTISCHLLHRPADTSCTSQTCAECSYFPFSFLYY